MANNKIGRVPKQKQGKRGRPANKKYGVRFRNRFVEVYKQLGGHVANTCKHMGISRVTYYKWQEKHPKFRTKLEAVLLRMDDNVDQSIYLSATEDRNVRAMELWKKTKGSDISKIKRAIKQYIDSKGMQVLDPTTVVLDKNLALKESIVRFQFLFYVCLASGKLKEATDIQNKLNELQGVYELDLDREAEVLTGAKLIGIFDELELTKGITDKEDGKVMINSLIDSSEYGQLYKSMFPADNPIIDIDYEQAENTKE